MKREPILDVVFPTYPLVEKKGVSKLARTQKKYGWRREINEAVHAKAIQKGITFSARQPLEIEFHVGLPLDQFWFHDVDNLAKQLLDALQGRFGGPKRIYGGQRIVPNDSQIVRVDVEKYLHGGKARGQAHLVIREQVLSEPPQNLPDPDPPDQESLQSTSVHALSSEVIDKLTEACLAVPIAVGEYKQDDFLTNVLLTVLDIQMHNVAVNNSIQHYWDHRYKEIRILDDLEDLLDRYPNDHDGNLTIARYLWGNHYWNRVGWLRGFTEFLRERDLTNMEALRRWALEGTFERDFKGKVKNLGIGAYQWLKMRLGADTVKPDTHLRRFAERVAGRSFNDSDLIRAFEEVAQRLGKSPRELDWSIWEFERGGPGTI